MPIATKAGLFLSSACIAFATLPIQAEQLPLPDISPDRPSIGTGPDIVPLRSVQIEGGLNICYSRSSIVTDLPESLLRIGISRRAEFRFGSSNAVWNPSPVAGSKRLQSQDVSIGSKIAFTHANHRLPQSVLLSFTIPTGGPSYTSGSIDPAGVMIWQQSTRRGLSFTENIAALYTKAGVSRQVSWSPGISAARNISRTVAWYGEYAPTLSPGPRLLQVIDGGLSCSRHGRSQFDVRAGVQNDASGVHNLLSAGYSVRLDGLGMGAGARRRAQ